MPNVRAPVIGSGTSGLAQESFRAYLANAQAINSGAETVIAFDAEDWDVSARHDITTNKGRFTPKVAGYYRIGGAAQWSSSLADQKQVRLVVYKNGSAEAYLVLCQTSGATASVLFSGSALVSANGSTDYFELAIYHNDSGAKNVGSGRTVTYWCGELVGKS